jgi:hypothetical protein
MRGKSKIMPLQPTPSQPTPKKEMWAVRVANPKTPRLGTPPIVEDVESVKPPVMSYKGGSYVVHTGRRGGKYIKVGDRKIYLRK